MAETEKIVALEKQVSELQSELEKYRGLVEHSNDAILSLDLLGNFRFVNQKTCDLLGYSGEELLGRHFSKVVLPKYLPQCVFLIQRLIWGKKPVMFSLEIRAKNGEVIPIEINGIGIKKDEKVVGIQVIGRDLRDKRAAEEVIKRQDEEKKKTQLLEAKMRETEELNFFKQRMVNAFAHELRTPITSINIYAEMLAGSKEIRDGQKKALNVILSDSKRLASLIEKLLQTIKIQAQAQELNISEFSLDKTVGECLLITQPIRESKAVKLVESIPKGIKLLNDREKFVIVLNNLVDNALKFVPNKGLVEVKAVKKDDDILVSVSDDGPSIPQDAMDRLFEEFYQVGDSATRKTGGVGLGLSICKRLVETMRGSIWIESGEGKGVTVFFSIPLRVTIK
ncbi:MAG: PAS domain-containing sensor histidine kinase [Candidatus Diapherotrites archaeon]